MQGVAGSDNWRAGSEISDGGRKIPTFIESEKTSLSDSEGISLSGSESTSLSITETTSETTAEVYAPPYEPPEVKRAHRDTMELTHARKAADMTGRKSKYTPETAGKLADAIRLGATYKLACAYAGISEDTFARWQARYAEFADAVKKAEGAAVVGWLAKIEKAAADGNWQAAAWKLERRYPDMYGRNRLELTGANGGPVRMEGRPLPPLPDDTLDDILAS